MRVGPHPDLRATTRWWLAVAVLSMLIACRDRSAKAEPSTDESAEAQPRADADASHITSATAPARDRVEDASPSVLRIHHSDDLSSADFAAVEELDLALSVVDQLGHLAERETETACDRLDLRRIATAAPRLRSLRISGCADALASGLGDFSARLETLTLVDVSLDAGAIAELGRLEGLASLTLIRVEPQTDVFRPLARLALTRLELHELGRDSELAALLELWPRSLRGVVLAGGWAGHKAMTSLSKAEALETLELRDTRVGNFSLNQIKPLHRLRQVSFRGDTFNDNSPLYFRELPVERFECACPRLGDGGLRSLRHSAGIRHLELHQSQVTGPGLGILSTLKHLRSVVIHDRDIGSEGLAALTELSELESLELSGTLAHTRLDQLGELTKLRRLVLDYREIDDRVAPQLAKLVNLEHLGLGGTGVSDEALSALEGLSALRVLLLDRTRVTNRGLAHVGKLELLEILALDHTDVVDAGIAHLAGLRNLQELTLDHTLVTDAAIDHLMGMKRLERLGLGGTVVTADGVAKLARLPNLRAVNLAGTRATGP